MDKEQSPVVYFCTNMRFSSSAPSCGMRGSEKVLELVKQELGKRGVSYPIEKFICLGQCSFGPAVRIAPGGEFFLAATKDKVVEIADWIEKEMGAPG